jgi:Secretion system C-terminal sorting domain
MLFFTKQSLTGLAAIIFSPLFARAQFTIQNGVVLQTNGNAVITLQDIDLVNNGIINQQPGEGKFVFTGTADNTVSGSSIPLFDVFETAKTGTAKTLLLQNINIGSSINFTSGLIDLNNYNIILQPAALLTGENENSRITGNSGGYIEITSTLNAPSAINPGNLGATITSTQNPGSTIIRRGHQSQTNGSGNGKSILRYYDILPTSNSSLDATLRFQYFDSELNGLTESSLVFYNSPDDIHWVNQGFTTIDISSNYVEKTHIPSFAKWTLSEVNNALPVHFSLLDVRCNGNTVLINWKTAQEQNSQYYDIERSPDGIGWEVIGKLPAAGNSTTEKNYLFADNNPVQNSYYRVAQYDVDGKRQYSGILKSSCAMAGLLSLWPNPAKNSVYINMGVAAGTVTVIKVYDCKGALLKMQKADLQPGNNQLRVDISNLPGGVYQFAIEWNNGQNKKTMQLVKK